jgi:hypothetical protein
MLDECCIAVLLAKEAYRVVGKEVEVESESESELVESNTPSLLDHHELLAYWTDGEMMGQQTVGELVKR